LGWHSGFPLNDIKRPLIKQECLLPIPLARTRSTDEGASLCMAN